MRPSGALMHLAYNLGPRCAVYRPRFDKNLTKTGVG